MSAAVYGDNLNAVLADVDDELPSRDHYVEFANVMEYARWLHDKVGYYVFNPEAALRFVRRWIQDLIDSTQALSDRNIALALEGAGYEYIDWLYEKVGYTRPPVKAGEGPRQAYRGSWADITGNLRSATVFRVDGGSVERADAPQPDTKHDELAYP